jgi:omega-6 fatty acid desaturase (delta-12 desaturase)
MTIGAVATEGRRSLKPVLDALPAKVHENPTWRGLWIFGRDAAMYLGLLVALCLVPWWAQLALEIPMALVVSGLFIVGHDAAHQSLFKSKRLNSWIGHISMLPSWHVYEGWVLGHNRVHHAFTVREGYDFVWQPATPESWAKTGPWRRLVHRFEWSWMGAGLYYLHEVWMKKMIIGAPPARWRSATRRDRFIVLGFVTAMVGLFAGIAMAQGRGLWGITWLVLATVVIPFLTFNYVIGSFVHVHHVDPELRWYRKDEWDKFRAQMQGTTVLRAPKWLNFFIHWIMVHVPHHVDMRIPMYRLEAATTAIKEAFPGVIIDRKLRFRDFVRNSRACKIYDYDQGRWLRYRDIGASKAPHAAA